MSLVPQDPLKSSRGLPRDPQEDMINQNLPPDTLELILNTWDPRAIFWDLCTPVNLGIKLKKIIILQKNNRNKRTKKSTKIK